LLPHQALGYRNRGSWARRRGRRGSGASRSAGRARRGDGRLARGRGAAARRATGGPQDCIGLADGSGAVWRTSGRPASSRRRPRSRPPRLLARRYRYRRPWASGCGQRGSVRISGAKRARSAHRRSRSRSHGPPPRRAAIRHAARAAIVMRAAWRTSGRPASSRRRPRRRPATCCHRMESSRPSAAWPSLTAQRAGGQDWFGLTAGSQRFATLAPTPSRAPGARRGRPAGSRRRPTCRPPACCRARGPGEPQSQIAG
jgi:hypothetical protein